MRKLVAIGLLIAAIPAVAFAQSEMVVGNFTVSVKKDPFGDGNTAVALTGDASHGLALRCLDGALSVAIGPDAGKLTPGDTYALKFRADQKPVVETSSIALDDMLVELADGETFFDNISGARTLAVRLDGPTTVVTFTLSLRQSDRAVAIVKKSCGK